MTMVFFLSWIIIFSGNINSELQLKHSLAGSPSHHGFGAFQILFFFFKLEGVYWRGIVIESRQLFEFRLI